MQSSDATRRENANSYPHALQKVDQPETESPFRQVNAASTVEKICRAMSASGNPVRRSDAANHGMEMTWRNSSLQ